ncbi:omptin family outer membrane protease [Mesorhizobium sp. M3A.F.Ca.ET.201.01.1.1]|nr:MAG: omptin family outer membrane protease [Mesorhizobium sp.]TGS65977.1 omptin family outer membrane protease [Mesorhizobium sp. M3A.F.Ca.ET.201.01.1.1]
MQRTRQRAMTKAVPDIASEFNVFAPMPSNGRRDKQRLQTGAVSRRRSTKETEVPRRPHESLHISICNSCFRHVLHIVDHRHGGAFDHLFSARQERRVSWWRWLHLAKGQRAFLRRSGQSYQQIDLGNRRAGSDHRAKGRGLEELDHLSQRRIAGQDWSDQSIHPDTRLDRYINLDMAAGPDFVINDATVINLHGGFKYTNMMRFVHIEWGRLRLSRGSRQVPGRRTGHRLRTALFRPVPWRESDHDARELDALGSAPQRLHR